MKNSEKLPPHVRRLFEPEVLAKLDELNVELVGELAAVLEDCGPVFCAGVLASFVVGLHDDDAEAREVVYRLANLWERTKPPRR